MFISRRMEIKNKRKDKIRMGRRKIREGQDKCNSKEDIEEHLENKK